MAAFSLDRALSSTADESNTVLLSLSRRPAVHSSRAEADSSIPPFLLVYIFPTHIHNPPHPPHPIPLTSEKSHLSRTSWWATCWGGSSWHLAAAAINVCAERGPSSPACRHQQRCAPGGRCYVGNSPALQPAAYPSPVSRWPALQPLRIYGWRCGPEHSRITAGSGL